MAPADQVARLRLIRSDTIGPITYFQLLARFGSAQAALDAIPGLAARGGGQAPRLASSADAEREIAGYQEAFGVFARPGLVSIALVQGHAVGAGFQLALACDLRIAAEDAQFTMAEPSLGLVPDLGGTQSLVELIGYARALEICATGSGFAAATLRRRQYTDGGSGPTGCSMSRTVETTSR